MKINKILVTTIIVALLLGGGASPASGAVPALPHSFYGAVEINDSPAPVGTEVEARGEGVKTGIQGNPITTTEAGKYGGSGGLDPKLVVQGNIEEGATLTFYVDGESTGQTAEWHSGEVTELKLSVTIAPPRGGGAAPSYYTDTNLFGTEGRFRTDRHGEVQSTVEATSEDGMLTITIPKGTIALDKDGDWLDSLEAAVDESPPDPPEDACIIGLAYDFGPDGATFDPSITLTWSYDPEALPEDVAEDDLVVAYYDEVWVELDCVVDTENDTITASVEHFTTFAIIGAITPPEEEVEEIAEEEEVEEIPEEVAVEEIAELEETISELEAQVASLRGDYDTAKSDLAATQDQVESAQAKVASAQRDYDRAKSDLAAAQAQVASAQRDYDRAKSDVAAAQAQVASFQSDLAKAQEGLAEAQERLDELEAAPINWGIIGGIIAAVVVVGLLIFLLDIRRRA